MCPYQYTTDITFLLSELTFFKKLFIAPDNSALVKIIWRQFDGHLVSGKDTNKVHAKLAADMSKYNMLILKFHFEHCVRKLFKNFSFYFNDI